MTKIRLYLSLFLGILFVAGICLFIRKDTTPPIATKCAFCNPAVLAKQSFYEDDQVMALLSYKPTYPGHTLVISKRHAERFEQLTAGEIAAIMAVLKKVHVAVSKVYGTSSYELKQKNGREVLQTVPHVHFHYTPRPNGFYSQAGFLLKTYLVALLNYRLDGAALQAEVERMKEAMRGELSEVSTPLFEAGAAPA